MLLCVVFLISISTGTIKAATPNGEPFAFVASEWKHPIFKEPRASTHVGDSFIFDCTTNDPSATVTLKYLEYNSGQYFDASKIFGTRLTKDGQKFSVSKIELGDLKKYQCSASANGKEIALLLGYLFVLKVPRKVEPDILQNATYKIETNGNDNVTCRAHGAIGETDSYLNWYREDVDGKRTLIDKNRIVRTEETTSNAHIDVEILMFKNFGRSDIGKYVCVRKFGNNDPTEKSINIELEPNLSPKVVFPDNASGFQSVKIGDQVILICDVKGSPKPDKYWQKNGKKVKDCPKQIEGDRCIHIIRKATFEQHNGEFECVGTNIVKTTSKAFRLEVQVPPLLKKPTTAIVANTKEDRELICEASAGNPLPTFLWERQPHSCVSVTNCKPLDNDWTPMPQQFPSKDTPTNESSVIATATTAIFFYRCSIQNKVGSDQHVITLFRKDEAPPQFYFESNQKTLNEKEKLSLKCVADLYIFKSIKLKKDGKAITGELSTVNQTMVLSTTIKEAALTDSGTYSCIGSLKRGRQREKDVKIQVQKIFPPALVSFNDLTLSQDRTKHHSIICQTTGNPKPSVTWLKDDKPIQAVTIPHISRCNNLVSGVYFLKDQADTLVFCSLDYKKHAGEYGCVATNSLGTARGKMYLTITAKPTIMNWVNETLFGVGLDETLTCKSEGFPPANVSWVLYGGNETLTRDIGISRLVISKVDNDNGGRYQCIAQNQHGKDARTTKVLIVGQTVAGKTSLIENKSTLTGIIIGFIAVLIIILILVLLYRRHLKTKYALYLEPNKDFVLDPNRTLFEQSSDLPYDMVWEFPRERVNFIEPLGSGAFGQVFLADADGIKRFKPRDSSQEARKRRKSIQRLRRYHQLKDKEKGLALACKVAIKTIKDVSSESEYKDLASELKILIHLGEHKNIVNLLGACTTKGKLFVILEYCEYGNLLSFLRAKRDIFQPLWAPLTTDPKTSFTYSDLVNIGCQISDGMDFLQSKKCIHRDLAARNVLVGQNYTMKIADFGLARDIYKDEFYLKETTGLLPIKWMSPESLFDRVYTTASDVWSFGIVLWETFTLGGSPYPGLPTEELTSYLESGARMKRPDICPKEVYSVMIDCWAKSPYQRPMFSQINNKLSYILTEKVPEGYIDMTLNTSLDSKPNPENGSIRNGSVSKSIKSDKASLISPEDDVKQEQYVQPNDIVEGDEDFGSADYLDAVTNGNVFSSPKGQTYVPPPPEIDYENTNSVSAETPLLSSPPPYDHEYIPMTPADHYKNPTSFSYGQEAMV